MICIKHTPSGGESANNAEMDATQILDAYIKLHTDYSGYVVDTSWLPADKAKMEQVLQQYWLQTTSAQIRKWLEDGWVFLAWFQDGVGPIPIDISSKVRSNVPAKQLGQYKKMVFSSIVASTAAAAAAAAASFEVAGSAGSCAR
ncbi:MAG: hypothetical protein WB689_28325 [Xanthobacteraceae bacterium]